MPATSSFLKGGPPELLAAAARRLAVPLDPSAAATRFERHAAPTSLRALVEIAPEFGLDARAFRSDAGGLAQANLPAIVHLREDGEESFALLVEHEADRVVLAAPPGLEPCRLSLDAFVAIWTGVVVPVSARDTSLPVASQPVRGPLGWLRETLDAQAPGGAAGGAARLLAGSAVLVLAIVAALRSGVTVVGSMGAAVAVSLAVLGAVVSASMLLASRRSHVPDTVPGLAARICGRGKLGDCEGVLASRWARVLGVDLSALGLALFVSNLALAAVAATLPDPALRDAWVWLALVYVAASPASLWLVAVQVWPLRRFCPLCMTVHAAVLVTAMLGAGMLAAWIVAGGRAGALWPYALLHAVLFLVALGFAPGWFEQILERRVLGTRLGWMTSTPWGALAELAGRSAVATPVRLAPIRLAAGRPFRIEALVHPMCSACPPVIDDLARIAQRHGDRVSVVLMLPPRDPHSRGDRELCAAIVAVGLAAGGLPTLHVLRAVKSDPWPLLALAEREGAQAVARKFLPEGFDVEPLLEGAHRAVDEADRLAEAIRRGTPTVLVQGRPWDAPLGDLDALLGSRASLLAAVLDLETVEEPTARHESV